MGPPPPPPPPGGRRGASGGAPGGGPGGAPGVCFKKGVNSLKTDNAGTYIIHDAEFRTLTSLASGKQYLTEAPKFLAFPCGLIRGALYTLQVTAHVTVEVSSL